MTYLQLCQFAHRYQQGGDDLPGTAPTTVVGQEGYLFETVMNVAFAYESIQDSQDQWLFMQKQGTFALPTGTRILTQAALEVQIADYDELRPNVASGGYRYCQLYADSAGVGSEAMCMYVPYQQFRGQLDNNTIPTGRPTLFTVQPNGSIEFNFLPDQDYSFVCDYKRTQDSWVQTGGAADDQTPIFPERFHKAIGWLAVMLWGGSIEATGKYAFARSEYEKIMGNMESAQLPELVLFTGQLCENGGVGRGG